MAPDYWGGQRLGDNLFSETLLCLDIETGQRMWHFQAAHHGLWDYDLPAAPNLLDITVDGREIKAVAQVTKQGFVFTFDRVTGEPVWPIEERPVPASDIPGERASPTQPFPTKPAPFEYQGVTIDDLVDFTPEIRRMAEEVVSHFRIGAALHAAVAGGGGGQPGHAGAAQRFGGRDLGRRRGRSGDRHAVRSLQQSLLRVPAARGAPPASRGTCATARRATAARRRACRRACRSSSRPIRG